jgi:4-hydroxybenzoate polyprenyltransferase
LSFSFICSSVYLLNDMLDLEADRAHQTKSVRPLAAGDLQIVTAVCLAIGLLVCGIALGFFCGPAFLAIVGVYFASNLVYSIWLKRIIMLDVVVLACFYTLRLLAGGAATGIGCSEWLLAFSLFFFFGLAMIKRYSELREASVLDPQGNRRYQRSDLDSVASVGVSGGMISVLVIVLYAMSPEVRVLYQKPTLLLLLCPLLLYWITRLWFKAHRGEVPQDPVLFALTDRTSYLVGIAAAGVLYAATF